MQIGAGRQTKVVDIGTLVQELGTGLVGHVGKGEHSGKHIVQAGLALAVYDGGHAEPGRGAGEVHLVSDLELQLLGQLVTGSQGIRF